MKRLWPLSICHLDIFLECLGEITEDLSISGFNFGTGKIRSGNVHHPTRIVIIVLLHIVLERNILDIIWLATVTKMS
jgi:hypothetical protein